MNERTRQPDVTLDGGNIRLYCGDCLEVLPTIEGVDAVVTDPPYPKEFDHVWDYLGKPCFDACKENAFLSTLCGHYQLPRVIDAARSGGWLWWWPCIATNNNQPIMHGFKAKCTHKPNPVFRKGKARPRRVFFDNFALRAKTADWQASQSAHKWGQAEALFFEPIDSLSSEGDTILDPFMGSGTTGVACVNTNRKFIGIEIDEGYFNTAVKRIQKAIRERSEQLITA